MPELRFPSRLPPAAPKRTARTCTAHRNWVRRHRCCVPGCRRTPIECAHVRTGTDGGIALKPSDRWVISLCVAHHREQHRLGETEFEATYSVDLRLLATEFAQRSPHSAKLTPSAGKDWSDSNPIAKKP